MPRVTWKTDEALTPFARLVRAWMWRQTPPLTVSQIADMSGVSKQAIWGWFQRESLPRRANVIKFAARTGLDVDELLRAAGLPDTTVNLAARRQDMRIYRMLILRVERELDADPHIPRRDRDRFTAWLRSHSALIAAGIETADDVAGALAGVEVAVVATPVVPVATAPDGARESRAHRRGAPASARA